MTTIEIREMKLDDIEEATLFLRDHFYKDEPLMLTPGDHPTNDDNPKTKEHRISLIKQGTSLVAVANDRIVGIVFAGVKHPQDVEREWTEANAQQRTLLTEHILYFLCNVRRNAKFFEHFNVSNALYLQNLAVDSSLRRQGLARRLVSSLIDVGKAKGFPLLVATGTNAYSTQLMLSLGMERVYSEAYADFKDEEANVLIAPPEPHKEATVVAIKLSIK